MDRYTLQLFEKTAGNYDIRCFSGETLISQHPLPGDELTAFIQRAEAEYASPALLAERLGQDLHAWLERVTNGCLSDMRGRSQAFSLHIDTNAGLRHLPWELLHDGDLFLCCQPRRAFTPVRRVNGYARNDTDPANRPLRVLFMASSPEKVEPVLNFEAEEARIIDATRHQGLDLVVEESGSLAGLKRVIDDYPADHFDVVHLTGHADIRDSSPGFWLEDDFGNPVFAGADDLAGALGHRAPRLLFLSGCRSGQGPSGGGVPSLAEALVDAGVPAVLGWALPVGDVSAARAAACLYDRLGSGDDLDAAVAQSRMALMTAKSAYWHLLRLYANATPPAACVTPKNTPGRKKRKRREAAQAFWQAAGGQRIPVCARADFVGRRRMIQRALRHLHAEPGDPGWSPGLLLKGMGGLGKSSLAARVCDRMSPTHDHWIWYGGIDETEMRRVFTEKLDSADVNAVLNDPDPNRSFYQRLVNILENHVSRPLLLVFDDFEHNAEVTAASTPGGRPAPRTTDSGALILKPGARDAMAALIRAVNESDTDCRVLITCRYGVDLNVRELSLDSLRGADLAKKTGALDAFAETSAVDPALQVRAKELAAGNPRLLEWLNTVLLDSETDHAAVLDRLTAKTAEFREDVLLEALLEQLRTPVLRTLALLSLYRLPVPPAAVTALSDDPDVPGHLARISKLGLAERIAVGVSNEMADALYFASPLLADLLAGELTEAEIQDAWRVGARFLKKLWWDDVAGLSEDQALEIRRLALSGREDGITVEITKRLANAANYLARYRDAEVWCREALAVFEDWRVLYQLARAEKVMGHSEAESHYKLALELAPEVSEVSAENDLRDYSAMLGNYANLRFQNGFLDDALSLLSESLQLKEKIGDVQGKAAMLHNKACVVARQGDVKEALRLWNESLQTHEKIDNYRGKAATVHEMTKVISRQGDNKKAFGLWGECWQIFEQIGDNKGRAAAMASMAGSAAQQGDIQKAMGLLGQSLKVYKEIGDAQGKAVEMVNMALTIGRQGDQENARLLNYQALSDLVEMGAWLDVVNALSNLSHFLDETESIGCLAQGLWLCLRVQVPLTDSVNLCAQLIQKTGGVKADPAPLLTGTMVFFLCIRSKNHPQREELAGKVARILAACAKVRKITDNKFQQWIETEGLLDPVRLLPKLITLLESYITDWYFDRSAFKGRQ